MGLLDRMTAEIEKLNPTHLLAEIEALKTKGEAIESRIAQTEELASKLFTALQQIAPILETAFPQVASEITAVITTLTALQHDANPPPPAQP